MDATGARLEALLRDCDSQSRRRRDPVEFVHRYEGRVDREVAGLIAASLAFGNARAARNSIQRVLESLGDAPGTAVSTLSRRTIRRRLGGFVHRIYRAEHLGPMLSNAGSLIGQYGSLGAAFEDFHATTGGDFRESLALFADRLRGVSTARSMRHLVSDPRAGSACKRLLLYARWMIRKPDGVDLGLWAISPSELIIPVDTHIHRISRNLGLTERRTASWATAEEITAALRGYDPDDPVKYDFALCHLGVSRECPSRPVLAKCERCALQEVCSVWAEGRSSAQRRKPVSLGSSA